MTETIDLKVGDQLKLDRDSDPRKWWTVRATDERFAVCVRQAPFHGTGEVFYTILDFRNDVRGPCNLIGQGWGDGTYSVEECEHLLRALNAEIEWQEFMRRDHEENGTTTWATPDEPMVEVSHRNRVPLRILERRPGGHS